MKCPHCAISFHATWVENWIDENSDSLWRIRITNCPGCNKDTIEISLDDEDGDQPLLSWQVVYPKGSNRGPVPKQVPTNIAQDYLEACLVLPLSAKASAALSRRCLQSILRAHGYKARDLAQEIDLLLSEQNPTKAIPETLRATVDGIRNFGNFSAHPVTDITSLQIIDVEEHEAEWCLEILEEMFEHFYVKPAQVAARKAALNAKLAAAGKPAAK